MRASREVAAEDITEPPITTGRSAHDLQRLNNIAQAAPRTETAAPALDRDRGKSFGLKPLAGGTRVATATCKPQSRAACAIGKKCETKNQSSVTR
jgi:hypothetical protein